MLRALSSRQLGELYAFCALEPVDAGLRGLAAEWFALYSRSKGDEDAHPQDWMRDFAAELIDDDPELRARALEKMFFAAAGAAPNRNEEVA